MLAEIIAPCLALPPDEAARLLALSTDGLFSDPTYQTLVDSLDRKTLHQTADFVRDAYEQGLPAIKARYNWSDTVMGGYTLCNWVLGFLKYPERLPDLIERHARIDPRAMRQALPEILALLDHLPQGRQEWQRALITFSLPLIVGK